MKTKAIPNMALLRSILFWDIKIESIDWQNQKKVVIKRVFERSNDIEKNEIIRFYGQQAVDEILKNT